MNENEREHFKAKIEADLYFLAVECENAEAEKALMDVLRKLRDTHLDSYYYN